MLKGLLKLFKKEEKLTPVQQFLKQMDIEKIYYPGAGSGAMESFLEKAIEKGFIQIKEVGKDE